MRRPTGDGARDRPEQTLHAIVELVLEELDGRASEACSADCRRFVSAYRRAMQPIYRLAIDALALLLELSTLPRCGRAFSRAPPDVRRAAVLRWRESRFGPKRDLVRLPLVLTLLARFERDDALALPEALREASRATLAFYNGGPQP